MSNSVVIALVVTHERREINMRAKNGRLPGIEDHR